MVASRQLARSRGVLDVEVHRGPDGLEALAEPWRHVLDRAGRRRFFHLRRWWQCYLEALEARPDSVSFYMLRDDRGPVAIVPLKRTLNRSFGLRVSEWSLPHHAHMPLADIVCARDASMPDIFAALRGALNDQESAPWDILRFDNVPGESMLSSQADNSRCRVLLAPSKSCDQVICSGSYREMTARFSGNFRSNLNKARKKLAKEAGVEFERVTRAPELMCCFEEFLHLEASGWKGAEGTAIRLQDELICFYRNLLDRFGKDDMAAINCLRLRGELIAGQLCLRDEDTLYVLKLAFAEHCARLAPGNMLLEWVIREGMERGLYRYVNLVGDPPWFKDWRPMSTPVVTLSAFNATPVGWIVRRLRELKRTLKPLYRKCRPRLQSLRAGPACPPGRC